MTADWLEYAAGQFDPHGNRPAGWPDPMALARDLDPATVTTPALTMIAQALVECARSHSGRLIISVPPQEGKLVDDDELVPTPDGWVRHGDLRVGDHVLHPSGVPVAVLAVHPPAAASVRVTFSDHTSVVVHPAHEWTVYDRGRHRWITLETRQLAAHPLGHGTPGVRGSQWRYHLPCREAWQLPDVDLPIDPYTLGVWLGDGSTTKAAVTHHPDDTYTLPYPETARCVHSTTGIITSYYRGGLHTALHTAGLLGHKHIPAAYLRASEAQRRALLAGLIDTDGHVAASGQVSFDNTDQALVEATAELIRTLGYRAHVHRPTPPKLSTSGIQGRKPMWRVTFTPHDRGPARLARKAATKLGRRERVAITGIEPVTPRPGRCITVDAADGLYLVGPGMLPTHNSTLASRRFPLWMLTDRPDTRIAIASYGTSVARTHARAVRDDIFTHGARLGIGVRKDLAAQTEWQLDGHLGGMYATGIGGALTGRPVDLLIIDDPLKDRQAAESDLMRQVCWDWWTDVGATRLAPGAPVVVILTRWHEDDLAGRLLAAPDGHLWRVVNIPAQADTQPDILGRKPGEYMQSARGRTHAEWEAIRLRSPARTWTSLYQGRPAPVGGDILRRGHWRYWDGDLWTADPDGRCWVPPQAGQQMVASWDMTFKDAAHADYVVGQVWLMRGADTFLLDQTRARMGFTDTLAAFKAQVARWPQLGGKLVEDKANGTAIIDTLRREIPGIVPVTPTESKEARAHSITPYLAAGNVHLPPVGRFPWVAGLVDEAAAFPNDAHDDQVDATTQALRHLYGDTAGAAAWTQYLRRKAQASSTPTAETPDVDPRVAAWREQQQRGGGL